MDPRFLQRAAVGATLAMALLMVLLQFAFTPDRQAPTGLFLLFTGLWLFGAAMLWRSPAFGAVGTASWGALAAVGAYQTHRGFQAEDAALVLGSLAAAALAVAFLVALRRAPVASP